MENEVYEPREDSMLLEKYVRKLAKGVVLDVGTGTGILAKAAVEKADFVIGVDISRKAIEMCNHTKPEKTLFLESDLFSAFEGSKKKFDTVIFNAPYLPNEGPKDIALDGGKNGYEVIERFLKESKRFLSKDGIILLAFSSLTGKEKVNELIRLNGMKSEELESIHFFFEDIYCYKIENG